MLHPRSSGPHLSPGSLVTSPTIVVYVLGLLLRVSGFPPSSGLRQRATSPVVGVTCSGLLKGPCGPSQKVGERTPWGANLINMEENRQINELLSNTVLHIRPLKTSSQTRQSALFANVVTPLYSPSSGPHALPGSACLPGVALTNEVLDESSGSAVFSTDSRKTYQMVLCKNFMHIMIKHDSLKLVQAHSKPSMTTPSPLGKTGSFSSASRGSSVGTSEKDWH